MITLTELIRLRDRVFQHQLHYTAWDEEFSYWLAHWIKLSKFIDAMIDHAGRF